MLATAKGIVGLGTARNTRVQVVVEVLDAESTVDSDDWDHIVDGALEVKAGCVVVASITDYLPNAQRVPLEPA
jgi:hypothetical protein